MVPAQSPQTWGMLAAGLALKRSIKADRAAKEQESRVFAAHAALGLASAA